jgi:hypothetical protein
LASHSSPSPCWPSGAATSPDPRSRHPWGWRARPQPSSE